MGSWDVGLYANDLALDLKAAIGAVTRVPVDEPQLVKLICEVYPDASGDDSDAEYTTFWLVLADQLHRRGITCRDVTESAMEIIDSGRDLKLMNELGLSPADLGKRKKVLQKLREQLEQPVTQKERKTLKEPQPFLMDKGDVYVYPIDDAGHTYNPYFSDATWKKYHPTPWSSVDWGAAAIIDRGRAFGYLAYYTPVVIIDRLNVKHKPELELLKQQRWSLEEAGTCPKTHLQRMRLESAGQIKIDHHRLLVKYPRLDNGIAAAAGDISISNRLSVNSKVKYRVDHPSRMIESLYVISD